jgi:hypothetical protein
VVCLAALIQWSILAFVAHTSANPVNSFVFAGPEAFHAPEFHPTFAAVLLP